MNNQIYIEKSYEREESVLGNLGGGMGSPFGGLGMGTFGGMGMPAKKYIVCTKL